MAATTRPLGKGLIEATLVLDVALRLEKLLQKEPGVEVVLTRRTDVYVPLEERTEIANRQNADMFLSIHANASRNDDARGIETFFLSFASSPDAEAVAARENSASEREMHQLPDMIKAITFNNKLDESRDLASMVQESLVTTLRKTNKEVRSRGVKKAPFVVLIGAAMPSVLAEISFVSNRQELTLLKTPAYQERLRRRCTTRLRIPPSLKHAGDDGACRSDLGAEEIVLVAARLDVVIARRERYQMKSAPAERPATIAATMITPVSPNAATTTSIMLSSARARSGAIWTIVTAGSCCTGSGCTPELDSEQPPRPSRYGAVALTASRRSRRAPLRSACGSWLRSRPSAATACSLRPTPCRRYRDAPTARRRRIPCRNIAAVIEPAGRPGLFSMSAISLFSCSLVLLEQRHRPHFFAGSLGRARHARPTAAACRRARS